METKKVVEDFLLNPNEENKKRVLESGLAVKLIISSEVGVKKLISSVNTVIEWLSVYDRSSGEVKNLAMKMEGSIG